MENSIVPNYVTEKYYDAFESDTLPIYLGAPNVKDFQVANHSVIYINDFPDIESVANYIKHLDQNEEEYNEYFSWKKNQELVLPSFRRFQEKSMLNFPCIACKYLSDMNTNGSQ